MFPEQHPSKRKPKRKSGERVSVCMHARTLILSTGRQMDLVEGQYLDFNVNAHIWIYSYTDEALSAIIK